MSKSMKGIGDYEKEWLIDSASILNLCSIDPLASLHRMPNPDGCAEEIYASVNGRDYTIYHGIGEISVYPQGEYDHDDPIYHAYAESINSWDYFWISS